MNRLVHPNRIYQALSSFALAAFAIAALALALASLSNCRVSPAPGSCRTSQDCKDPAREGHDPAKLVCHPSLGTCVASVDGGVRDVGPDGPPIKKKKGAACGSTAQCESGLFCVDDVCCTAECSGVCEACNLGTSVGDCVKASAGTDPRKKCGGDPGCDGTCDGSGSCSFAAVKDQSCQGASCTAGSLTEHACTD
ncbi:MAG: hypothetical protein QG573_825 [Acidobacteriota bacterium]|nr:hypothetical protein [Acidobacteriota bacterium]